jgi:hypothetical protein
MHTHAKDDSSPASANHERPDAGNPQPHPEKSTKSPRAEDAAREATRRYVERVDRYLARPDVVRAASLVANNRSVLAHRADGTST